VAVSVAIVASVLLASCQWAMYGGGPGRTGWNTAESTVGVGNVAQLQPAWTAPVLLAEPFVVAGNLLYASVDVGQPNAVVEVFDALGAAGCAGTPKACAPLWYAVVPGTSGAGGASPLVDHGTLFITWNGTVYAFDATGTVGCGGTPKTCAPLWSAPGHAGHLLVDHGMLFAFTDDPTATDIVGYDATGTNGCAGSPKVCAPVWHGTVSGCTFALSCSPTGALMAANGRLFVQVSTVDPYGDFQSGQAWFDENGVTGCSGSPPHCVATIGSGGLVAIGPVGTHGSIVSTYQTIGDQGSAAIVVVTDPTSQLLWDQVVQTAPPGNNASSAIGKAAAEGSTVFLPTGSGVQAWAVDQPATCTRLTTAPPCQPLWRTAGPAIELSVANGVLYDDAGRAYDASGTVNCSGTPKTCTPIAQVGPTAHNAARTETEIVNGWVYREVANTILAYHLP
jgi:hypothetical protein